MSGKKILLISILVIILLAIPATIYIVQKQQQTKSHATASTTLAFSPASGTKNVNDTIDFNININPGSNLVSFVSLDITYDPTKLEPVGSTALTIDKTILPIILQGPVYTSGRIRINLSTGNDPTAAIKAAATIGTLSMKAIGGTGTSTTPLAFGSSTQILSVAGPSTGSNDSAGENVLSTSTPALITIAGGTSNPTSNATVSPTTIALQPSDTPTVAPTKSVTPSSTPVVTITQPAATTSPSPTPSPTTPAATATPAPTLLADGPTSVPTTIPTATSAPVDTPTTNGSVNSASAFITNTPTPSLTATGPGLTFIGFGALLGLLIIGGGLLFFAL